MIERLMSLNHFTYKKPFSGSDKANRFKYIIKMIEEEIPLDEKEVEEGAKPKKIKYFLATCWVGEFNSKITSDEEKLVRKFDFSEEGYDEVIKWLNEESDKV